MMKRLKWPMVLVVVWALASCQYLRDTTAPLVELNLLDGAVIRVNDVITVFAEDPESGIARIDLRIGGVLVDQLLVREDERDRFPVRFDVEVPEQFGVGGTFEIEAEATNGVGLKATASAEVTVPVPLPPDDDDENGDEENGEENGEA